MDTFQIQLYLNRMFPTLGLVTDGLMGGKTREGIKHFQVCNKVNHTGVMDAATIAKFKEAAKAHRPPLKKTAFYYHLRTMLGGSLSEKQVQGIEGLLTEWDSRTDLTDFRFLAYVLATVRRECGNNMYPVEEIGKGKGRKYGSKVRLSGKLYTFPNKIYYGRGYVQITWYENYAEMGRILGLNLLEQPELALVPPIAAKIIWEGMTFGKSGRGDFTGKAMEHYFDFGKEDWVNARRIVNGLDVADLIAGYGKTFYGVIKKSL